VANPETLNIRYVRSWRQVSRPRAEERRIDHPHLAAFRGGDRAVLDCRTQPFGLEFTSCGIPRITEPKDG
jgi:hypothetical protein